MHCLVQMKQDASIWDLTSDSIAVLEATEFGNLFARRRTPTQEELAALWSRRREYARLHHLCLFRAGEAMLSVFEEQRPEVWLSLRNEEFDLFIRANSDVRIRFDGTDVFVDPHSEGI